MRADLEAVLFHRYPALFERRELSPGVHAMQRGFECGDGWFDLIDTLCSNLQYLTDHAESPQVRVTQVKSKMGTLRFYFIGSGDQYARGMAHMATAFSALVCEECGQTRCREHGAQTTSDIAEGSN